mgnify:CR=1 FL=1
MDLAFIDGFLLKELILAAAGNLEEKKAEINALNVFPVPDGDTGTNMSLTMAAASKEMQSADPNNLDEIVRAVSMGSLMGARGNSGVILSQLFRGFADSVQGLDTIGPRDLARALEAAVATAYRAVMKPAEGTILTVAREGARAARRAAREGADIAAIVTAFYDEACATLRRTPDMLPVLKEAGVVDAGGMGLVVIVEGALKVLRGERTQTLAEPEGEAQKAAFTITDDMADITFPYDTEVILVEAKVKEDELRHALSDYGDSIVVVGSGELIKIHIHTDNPSEVLEFCLAKGVVKEVQILNMIHQYEALQGARQEGEDPSGCEDGVGIVSVAVGEGLCEVFESLGVGKVVRGGQTMNPSTEDILAAVNELRERRVIILPNNKNVIAAAEQTKHLSDKEIHVLPSRSIPEGMTALLAWQPGGDLKQTLKQMREAMENVKTGEVTYAVRSARLGDMDIDQGTILGLSDGQIVVTGQSRTEVALGLLEKMVDDETEVVTIFFGEDVSEEEAIDLAEALSSKWPEMDVEVHSGGQPLYFYIFSVE